MRRKAKRRNLRIKNKIRGVYWRADKKGFWFAKKIKGKSRIFVDLETDVHAIAIERAELALTRILGDFGDSGTLQEDTGAFLEAKRGKRKYTSATERHRKYVYRRLIEFFGDTPTKSISEAHAKRFHDWLFSPKKVKGKVIPGMKPVSVGSYLNALNAFFNWMVDTAKKLPSNPFSSIERVIVRVKARMNFVTYEVFQRLIAKANTTGFGLTTDELKFILYCGFHAGMRKNEIINARPEWFDLNNLVIRITSEGDFEGAFNRKTITTEGRIHSVPMSNEFHAFLTTYDMDGPYCIAKSKSAPTSKKSRYRYEFRKPFDDYMKRSGVVCTAHDMRHSFVSHCVSKNIDFIKIAKWIGDSLQTVERHYAHLRPDDRTIDQAFGERGDHLNQAAA